MYVYIGLVPILSDLKYLSVSDCKLVLWTACQYNGQHMYIQKQPRWIVLTSHLIGHLNTILFIAFFK